MRSVVESEKSVLRGQLGAQQDRQIITHLKDHHLWQLLPRASLFLHHLATRTERCRLGRGGSLSDDTQSASHTSWRGSSKEWILFLCGSIRASVIPDRSGGCSKSRIGKDGWHVARCSRESTSTMADGKAMSGQGALQTGTDESTTRDCSTTRSAYTTLRSKAG